jgi:hypothetical protein
MRSNKYIKSLAQIAFLYMILIKKMECGDRQGQEAALAASTSLSLLP